MAMRGFGAATAQAGQGPSQATVPDQGQQSGGFVANPVTWVFVLAILVAAMIFFAHKTGKAEEFSNIRGSAYNVLEQTLVVIVGISVLKVIFTKFNVPGLSPMIQAV